MATNPYATSSPYDNLGYEVQFVTAGFVAAPGKAVSTDLKREYVAGRYSLNDWKIPRTLEEGVDRLSRTMGNRVYEAMMADPDVSAAINTLKMDALADGMQLVPRIGPGIEEEPTEEQKLAEEIAQFCQRNLLRLERPAESIAFEWLDSLWRGCKLAEKVYEVEDNGPDAGKLVLKAIRFKPRWAWRYVVDATMNVTGILTRKPPTGEYVVYDRSKFAISVWDQKDEDPRGNSVLRAAYHAWNLKQLTWPVYWRGVSQFGGPSLVGETAPDEPDQIPVDPDTGEAIPGADPVSPQAYLASQLVRFQSGSAIAVPNGSKVYTIESKQDGEGTKTFVELLKREITKAILLQVRATEEAQFGSRADSESATDVKGSAVRIVRKHAGLEWEREVLYQLVELNYGKEAADLYTPIVSFGGSEHHDFGSTAKAIATLYSTNYMAPSQLRYFDSKLGAPARTAEEVAAYRSALTQRQNQLQGPGIDNGTPAPDQGGEK